ncbi:hypothetical protein F4679DRAFT_573860 [Xylaria curta]|nr:hypothetical protein F4679DRAFT_573860 [Xylaria curta]
MDAIIHNHERGLVEPLHCIGMGRCGSNDSDIHQRLLEAYRSVRGSEIPLCCGYIPQEIVKKIIHRFPKGYQPCNILLTERILPVSVNFQHDLIHRPCLGEWCEIYKNSPFPAFLRNFEFRVNLMEELELDTRECSIRMAKAPAFMHRSARIDVIDVEFVLALADQRLEVMWSPVIDRRLWHEFRRSYLETSFAIIGPNDMGRRNHPLRFINVIESCIPTQLLTHHGAAVPAGPPF